MSRGYSAVLAIDVGRDNVCDDVCAYMCRVRRRRWTLSVVVGWSDCESRVAAEVDAEGDDRRRRVPTAVSLSSSSAIGGHMLCNVHYEHTAYASLDA